MGVYAQVKTPLPGPRSRAILEKKERYVPDAISIHLPVAIAEARGALFTDVDGNRFIDFAGGLGVLNVGHCPPAVVEAVIAQARRFLHTDFSVVMYESYVELAQRLAESLPGPSPKKVAFFNSGAEAVENAIKIARSYTGRPAVIALEGAFHGRTLLTMTLTSKPRPYKERFGPFAPEVYRVPAPYCYRCPLRSKYPECSLGCVEALKRAFHTQVAPEQVAAFIVEPVQGEGGFVVPPQEYHRAVKEVCQEHGILFIADEIQTGFGRTGHMWAMEYFGVEADLTCAAKSIAAGLPLSAVAGRSEIMDAPGDSAIGGTYVGNPVACVAALKVMDIMSEEQLVKRARQIGSALMERFRQLQEKFPLIGDVRGLGAMVAMELVKDRQTKEPATKETAALLKACMRRGLLAVKAGIYGNVMRILVPLVITDEQLAEGLDILEEALAEVSGAP